MTAIEKSQRLTRVYRERSCCCSPRSVEIRPENGCHYMFDHNARLLVVDQPQKQNPRDLSRGFIQMGRAGLEQCRLPSRKSPTSELGGSKSGNNTKTRGELSPAPPLSAPPIDPELAMVVAVWPTLPTAIWVGIIAMVKAANPECFQ